MALGPLLQLARTHFLHELDEARSMLVLGDGDGRFLAKLLARNTSVQALAVDSSQRMLHLLKRRCAFAGGRLQILHGEALNVLAPCATDVIVTHFFLDCFEQPDLEELVLQTALRCHTGVLWLVSDFKVPEQGLLRLPAAAYIRLLYLGFRVLTGLRVTCLPNTEAAFLKAGFHREKHAAFLGGMLYTELWRYHPPCPRSLVHNPNITGNIHQRMTTDEQNGFSPTIPMNDALPDPEPAVPSLTEPDPGVYHHTPASSTRKSLPGEKTSA